MKNLISFLFISIICFAAFNYQKVSATEDSRRTASSNSSILSVTLSKREVVGGTNLEGTVTLVSAATLGGNIVPLTSDNPAVVVPTSVTIPLGATKANFTVTTNSVEREINANVKAGPTEAQKTATLLVKPLTVNDLTLSANQVVGETNVQGRISINSPAVGRGFDISLSSNSTSARVPAQITVPAGQTFAAFEITTSKVSADTSVTISATDKAGGKASANLNVTLPLVPEILSMTTNSLATATNQHVVNLIFDRPLPSGHSIQLSSSNSSIISVPPNLRISTGIATHQLFVTPPQVASETPVTVTAVSGKSAKSVTFTVRPLLIETFTPSAANITGGSRVTGTLALNLPRSTATVVTLTSSDGSISIPSPITLPARADFSNPASVAFDIFTSSVDSQRSVIITATLPADLGGGQKTASITIAPVTLNTISLDTQRCDLSRNCPSTINGTVALTGPAPPEGVSLALSSDRPTAATVQPTLLIPSGQTTGLFTVSIQSGTPSAIVRITATGGSGSTKNTNLELEKTFLEVESISLNTTQVQGGTAVTGTVNVRQLRVLESNQTTVTPTTLGTNVRLSRIPSNYSGGQATGTFQPAALNVPGGQSSGQFTFTPAPVDSPTIIQVQAFADPQIMGSLASGVIRSANLTVNPATIQSINLSQTEVQGGQEVTGTIQMSGPVPFGNSVSVTGSDSGIATIIAPQFTNGSSGATFRINTSSAVTSPATITITASFAGQTATAQLIVTKPSVLSNVSFPSARILSGLQTTIRVELDGPAPSGGATVVLNSSIPQTLGLVNAQFTIPAGQNFVTIQPTPNSGLSQQLTLRADYHNQSKSTSVTVESLAVDVCNSSLGQNVVGGTPINCTVTLLNNAMVAPEGGIQFSIQNPNPGVLSTPATFTIPAGQSSAILNIATRSVTQNTNVNIQLSVPGAGFSRAFAITPP